MNNMMSAIGSELRGLLSVDLGVRTGMAYFTNIPELKWYRSSNFGNQNRLKKAIPGIFSSIPDCSHIVIEGGGPLAAPWIREADHRDITVILTTAEEWREALFHSRQHRSGTQAKQVALQKALEVITELNATKSKGPMQDDVAEAILCGYWAIRKIGWRA